MASNRGWGSGWPNCQSGNIVTVSRSDGLRLPVHREIASLVRMLCNLTEAMGYHIVPHWSWGYACRAIAGTNTPSNHSWGLAVDINAPVNPMRRPLTTNIPVPVRDLWKSHGFRWGGDYRGTPDAMHFEFMGTPQDARRITQRLSDFLKQPAPPSGPAGPYPDVPRDAYYTHPVAWAKWCGITTGIGNTGLFKPLDTITRAQAVTFIWRTMGQPRASKRHNFTDVASGSFYEPAVSWAAERGITTGVSGTRRFDPNGRMTRAQAVTMLWRLVNSPNVARHNFRDVASNTYYDKAVSWANRHGITTGVGGSNEFRPNNTVIRADMITFLFRMAVNRNAWNNTKPSPFKQF